MTAPLLLDLTHTSHTAARTGIQQVARALLRNLSANATPITHDPYAGVWRTLENWEMTKLARAGGGRKRGARWPLAARWRGRLRRGLGRSKHTAISGEFSGFIEPEIFSPTVFRQFPELFARVRGPRVALFLDAIPLRFPELTPPGTVARFPTYLQELLMFDGIAAISEESRDSLAAYWRWLGIASPPPVVAIPLGVDPLPCHLIHDKPAPSLPVVLCVGTLEGRKNHLALLDACESLWARGVRFQLRIIGHVNAETGGAALARLQQLQASGRPLLFDGPATDETIAQAYAECSFTVYPSIAEGFGLPVIESLARGKPCICSGRGALGEISRQGGCIPLATLDAAAIAGAIESLVNSPEHRTQLAAEARARTFKSWSDYARELKTWIQTLRRRD